MAEEAKEWFGHFQKAAAENRDLRARLAVVEAVTADLFGYLDWCDGCIPASEPKGSNVRAFAIKVRAAARGEGDRPAEATPTPHDFEHGFVDLHLTRHEDRCRAIIKWTDKRIGVCGAKRDHPIHNGEDDRD